MWGGHDERVQYIPHTEQEDRFLPQVSGGGVIRPFAHDDMVRVVDFDDIDAPPKDGTLMMMEGSPETNDMRFPVYHFCLRAGFLFYFDVEDVDDESGPFATYRQPPVGLIPLHSVQIEFPPGGRRVFREHAQTDARNGYELALLHFPQDGGEEEEEERPPFFLAADSLGRREKWSAAIQVRATVDKPTFVRAGYRNGAANPTSAVIMNDEANAMEKELQKEKKRTPRNGAGGKASVQQQVMDVSDDADLAQAVVEFGASEFDEKVWMENYFQIHDEFAAAMKCRQMAEWQMDMKKNLKGAVLEQYEYFVQASGEMNTMGLEIASLKNLLEMQGVTLKTMRDMDFVGALQDYERMQNTPEGDELIGRVNPMTEKLKETPSIVSTGDLSSSMVESSVAATDANASTDSTDAGPPEIHLPDWLLTATIDIKSFVRECRYNEAIELLNRSKAEAAELLDRHERPTLYQLTEKNIIQIHEMKKSFASLTVKIGKRLSESLRRKNEALKAASKRERSDPQSVPLSIVSPCAIQDDALYLNLLVKLGNPHEAADAYAARRSLLLLETLHERPIAGTGSVDLVIYAAQLSQSFFWCLANSIEGFLDLFLTTPSAAGGSNHPEEESSIAEASMQSHTTKNIPAGAVASVVLWADAELSKFASAFGGTRILANLALSPPSRDRGPRVVGQDDAGKERKTALDTAAKCIEQAFSHAADNLDSVGLPLAPRLAEYLRSRLKGCEAEISELLDDRWKQLTSEWRKIG